LPFDDPSAAKKKEIAQLIDGIPKKCRQAAA
jgi:hypothetical protein